MVVASLVCETGGVVVVAGQGGGGQGGGLVVTRGIPTSGVRRVRDAREGRGTERDGEGKRREREKEKKNNEMNIARPGFQAWKGRGGGGGIVELL